MHEHQATSSVGLEDDVHRTLQTVLSTSSYNSQTRKNRITIHCDKYSELGIDKEGGGCGNKSERAGEKGRDLLSSRRSIWSLTSCVKAKDFSWFLKIRPTAPTPITRLPLHTLHVNVCRQRKAQATTHTKIDSQAGRRTGW